jgi:hypothetical protein
MVIVVLGHGYHNRFEIAFQYQRMRMRMSLRVRVSLRMSLRARLMLKSQRYRLPRYTCMHDMSL